MDWQAVPVQAAFLTIVSAQVIMIVSTIVQTWNAIEQRKHDRMLDAVRKYRGAIAEMHRLVHRLRAVYRGDINVMAIEASLPEGYTLEPNGDTSHEDERDTVLADLAYWQSLLPPGLRRVGRTLLRDEREFLRSIERMHEKRVAKAPTEEESAEARKMLGRVQATRKSFYVASDKWMDEHAEA